MVSRIWLQNFQCTGEAQTLGGHKQNLVCTRTQEKGAVTPQETEPDLPVCAWESVAEAWVDSGLLQGQGHWLYQSWEAQHGSWHKSFWRRSPLPPLPLPKFGLRPIYREGTQPHPSAENWTKDLVSMALPTRTRPSFPHSQFLPSGSLHQPLFLIHQRAD